MDYSGLRTISIAIPEMYDINEYRVYVLPKL